MSDTPATPQDPKTRRRKRKERLKRKYADYQGYWQPIGSNGVAYSGTYDSFGALPDPTPVDLVSMFADTVYAVTTMIATGVADIDVKLCVETRAGQSPPTLRNSPIYNRQPKRREKAVELHEIHEHPALHLLYHPNPKMSYAELMTATELFLDIVGRAYWYVAKDEFGMPSRIDVLPAHLITTIRDENTNEVIGYRLGTQEEPTWLPETEDYFILPFRNYEYFDLSRQEGVSPLRAVWQKVQLSAKELSSWEIIVTQLAQPLVILSPKDSEGYMNPKNAERLAKEFTSRFYQSGKGGVYVNSEALEMTPVSWPPKDLAGLQLQDNLKSSICNVYHMPRPMLDLSDSNFASGKASERLFQLYCLSPRINYILERVNTCLVSRYNARLFLMAGDFISRDEAMELQRQNTAIAAVQARVITPNEARAYFDLPPTKEGADLLPYMISPTGGLIDVNPEGADQDLNTARASSKRVKSVQGTQPEDFPVKQVVAVLQKWFGEQSAYVLGKLGDKNFVDLTRFTRDMANELYPVFEAYYDRAGHSLITRLGLTDDVWQVTQPKIADAVQDAVFRFAESTNRTTTHELSEARDQLRRELAEGIITGDTTQELTRRVQSVFTRASDERAWLIADTERTRAVSKAELIAARESGVVEGKTWLADNMACPICSRLDGVTKTLNEPFLVDPSRGPYAVVQTPPGHPGCRCGQTYTLKD